VTGEGDSTDSRFMNKPGAAGVLLLLGSACLIVVVLTHVAEALHIFPSMGWGLPDSPGHYLDLVGAILGSALLPLGFLIALFRRKQRGAMKTRRQGMQRHGENGIGD
jgi:hypothetical protein